MVKEKAVKTTWTEAAEEIHGQNSGNQRVFEKSTVFVVLRSLKTRHGDVGVR